MSATHSATDTAIRAGVVVLTLIAAAVHLSLLFPDPAFILNGLGYLALLAALYLPIPQLVPYRACRACDADGVRNADDLALGSDRGA